MKRLIVLASILVIEATVPSSASNITGEVLSFACMGNVPGAKRDKDTEKHLQFCNAYITAWDDARYSFLKGTRTFCPPKISVKEMSLVLFDYVADHRETRDLPAVDALMLAFKAKWPCQD